MERTLQRRFCSEVSMTVQTVPAERRRVEAVLLDLDGTLLDSNDQHAKAWVDAFAEAGIETSFESVRELIGVGGAQIAEHIAKVRADDPKNARLCERADEILHERYLSEIQPQPCAFELVAKLRERGFRIAIATSTSAKNLPVLLSILGIEDLVDACTNADDVERAKPAPDVVCAALEKIGARAERAIMIGDTPYDVKAARAAGVAIIALRCGGWNYDALDGAIEIFLDPCDLLRNWMQTPFRSSIEGLDLPL
jgi:HAD superfamily hydrolase (TIGR01509 family)